jgi:hypothetical protein
MLCIPAGTLKYHQASLFTALGLKFATDKKQYKLRGPAKELKRKIPQVEGTE